MRAAVHVRIFAQTPRQARIEITCIEQTLLGQKRHRDKVARHRGVARWKPSPNSSRPRTQIVWGVISFNDVRDQPQFAEKINLFAWIVVMRTFRHRQYRCLNAHEMPITSKMIKFIFPNSALSRQSSKGEMGNSRFAEDRFRCPRNVINGRHE